MAKKDIYSKYGINYRGGKIEAPEFGFITPLLIDGNAKLGKGIWTWSTLPGTADYTINVGTTTAAKEITVKGTCLCDCPGCYAKTGFFRMGSTLKSLAIKTYLARNHPDFVKRAILAQIEADEVRLSRIHAAGDFFSDEYISLWHDIATACKDTAFWTYTKNSKAEHAFDDLPNINIVASCIPGIGFNFGHCDYILRVYAALKAAGYDPYICRCGIDKNQHCNNCTGCREKKFVLFLEHSTAYKAEEDPLFAEVVRLTEETARF